MASFTQIVAVFASGSAAADGGGGLRRDQRGAILVPAVAMGAMLVGALYYVASVGDAVIFRTQLQDAADTTAFKSAVWHANGMNMITVLNVIMSIALGVFALLRIVEVIVLALCLIPPIFPVASKVLETLAIRVERAIFNGVDKTLLVTHNLEKGVSMLTPWVAFGAAKSTPTAAETIWPVSLSLVPPVEFPARLESKLPGNVGVPRLPANGPAALPLQQDKFGNLCAKAFTILPKQLVAWLDGVKIPLLGNQLKKTTDAVLNDVATKVLGVGDGIFCQPAVGAFGTLIEMAADKLCGFANEKTESAEQAQADFEAEEERKREQANGGDSTRDNGADSNRTGTQTSGRSSSSRSGSSRGGAAGGGNICADVMKPFLAKLTDQLTFDRNVASAAMWAPAANGSPTTHVWSYAQATPRMWQTDRQGIAMAARGSKVPDIGDIPGASALGEFYFDCAAGWEHACEWDAMWAPGWTARLRRYRPPLRELADVGLNAVDVMLDELQRPLGEIVGEKVGEAVHAKTGLPAESPVSSFVGAFVDTFPFAQLYKENVASQIKFRRERSGLNEILNPRRYQNENEVH
jgi:hypothetical protein